MLSSGEALVDKINVMTQSRWSVLVLVCNYLSVGARVGHWRALVELLKPSTQEC